MPYRLHETRARATYKPRDEELRFPSHEILWVKDEARATIFQGHKFRSKLSDICLEGHSPGRPEEKTSVYLDDIGFYSADERDLGRNFLSWTSSNPYRLEGEYNFDETAYVEIKMSRQNGQSMHIPSDLITSTEDDKPFQGRRAPLQPTPILAQLVLFHDGQQSPRNAGKVWFIYHIRFQPIGRGDTAVKSQFFLCQSSHGCCKRGTRHFRCQGPELKLSSHLV